MSYRHSSYTSPLGSHSYNSTSYVSPLGNSRYSSLSSYDSYSSGSGLGRSKYGSGLGSSYGGSMGTLPGSSRLSRYDDTSSLSRYTPTSSSYSKPSRYDSLSSLYTPRTSYVPRSDYVPRSSRPTSSYDRDYSRTTYQATDSDVSPRRSARKTRFADEEPPSGKGASETDLKVKTSAKSSDTRTARSQRKE